MASALVHDPPVLLLDEPTSGLDLAVRREFLQQMVGLAGEGRTILIAESNIHHVPAWTRRLYVIERGEIIFAGTLDEAHRDRAVLRVIGGKAS